MVGGWNGADLNEIYRLSSPLTVTSQWQLLPQKLQTARHWHTAFFIPDSFVTCNDQANFEDI